MRRILTLLFCASIFTSCSNASKQPQAEDVEPFLRENLARGCPGLSLIEVRKTNGVNHGNYYTIAITYRLEIINIEHMCTALSGGGPQLYQFIVHNARIEKDNSASWSSLANGDTLSLDEEVKMEKSENGWIPVSSD